MQSFFLSALRSFFQARVLAMALVIASTGLAAPSLGQEEPDTNVAVSQARGLSKAFREAAARVSPAVVTVLVDNDEPQYGVSENGEVVPLRSDEDFDDSVGSGVIIHSRGFILTNSHVVANATRIKIRLADKRELEVDRVKLDKDSDVALLIIDKPPSGLPTANLGDSDQVDIGDWVIAIGSPFEYASTVSAGIISGRNRSLKQIKRGKLLQTDAAINPGNSGGPLVNLDGEVIAINTAIASSSGGYQGIGFAIPSNQARWVLTQLAKYGRVRRAYLGVDIRDLRNEDAVGAGVGIAYGGVWVNRVNDASPAAVAGLRKGDVIVKFGDVRVRDSRDLQGVVERQEAGTSHPVTYIRDGVQGTLSVVVERLPGAADSAERAAEPRYN